MPNPIALYFPQHLILAGCAMGYAELISKLESLPHDKQEEVFEFVEFLSARCAISTDKTRSRAEVAAQAWNTFNERSGSFADQHSTL